ncbi:hypothetical protein HYT26_02515 [Candidatus Pacearchaeota archaeon]|nr:hypothetical protein [Candidatus Pacearchaeota archaeon]
MEQTEDELDELRKSISIIKDKMQQYERPILYIGISIFILLIFAAGFGLGAEKICSQVNGFLDNKAYCHVNYYKEEAQQSKFNDFDFEQLEGLQ